MAAWTLGPFQKHPTPVLEPLSELTFDCPLGNKPVRWAEKDVFNPAAITHAGRVHLLFRAEDRTGHATGTSRIGLATSDDGIHFQVHAEPVLFPDPTNPAGIHELDLGCEDPRVCELDDGRFLMTYTAFDATLARLCVATSTDLVNWTKHGPAFTGHYKNHWSKSGSLVCRLVGGRLVATRLAGRYWMYWGEGVLFAATSVDGLSWEPLTYDAMANHLTRFQQGSWHNEWLPGSYAALRPLMFPRPGRFDHHLVEPGPPALLTDAGIVLIYNGSYPNPPAAVYAPGQVLFDAEDPTAVIARTLEPSFLPDAAWEVSGQIAEVCFAEGLVQFGGRWLLYYGAADSRIGVAMAPT